LKKNLKIKKEIKRLKRGGSITTINRGRGTRVALMLPLLSFDDERFIFAIFLK
jgi:hypothetical protein